MSQTLRPVANRASADSYRVPEDILRSALPTATAMEKSSPLVKRGRPIWEGNPDNGFPGFGQHFSGSGQARTPPFRDGRSGGLLFSGQGATTDGYGSYDANAGSYCRFARDVMDVYWTFSGRVQLRAEVPGAVSGLTFYFDTQAFDNSNRQYPPWVYSDDGKWKIGTPAGFVSVPGMNGLMLGDNEDKQGNIYFAVSYFHASDITQSHYGHIQFGGTIVDLRTLGSGGKPNATQVGIVPFGGGLNVGLGTDTPIAGKRGGFCLDRGEVTVGDVLV